jgi:transposase
MANIPITMSKVKNILRFLSDGLSKREIADRTRSSRKTVDKYEGIFVSHPFDYHKLLQLTNKELFSIIAPASEQSPSHIELYGLFPSMSEQLKKRGITKQLLWEDYKQKYPEGVQLSQFYEHFGRYNKSVNISYVFEHKPADKLMIDFAGEKLYLTDYDTGEQIALQVFVGILPCSGLTFAMATMSQQVPDFLNCISECLQFIGGVPQAIVTDNLKPAVTKASKYNPELNPNMADFADHYETTVLPTRAYKPKDKALVEGAVNILYTRVYSHIDKKVYHTLRELNADIKMLVEKHNQMQYQKKEGTRRKQFELLEKEVLKPLPPTKFELKSYQTAKVQANCHVYLSEDKHYYSVPYNYVGNKISISYNTEVVEVYYNYERISTHQRMKGIGKYSTTASHLHPHHAYYKNWSVEFFLKEGQKIGIHTAEFIQQLLLNCKHPEAGFKRCMGLLTYVKKYSKQELELACEIGLKYDYASLKQIEYLLQQTDLESLMEEKPTIRITHQNERGSNYYQ